MSVLLSFESVDEIFWCGQSDETSSASNFTLEYFYLSEQQHEILKDSATFNVNFVITLNEH